MKILIGSIEIGTSSSQVIEHQRLKMILKKEREEKNWMMKLFKIVLVVHDLLCVEFATTICQGAVKRKYQLSSAIIELFCRLESDDEVQSKYIIIILMFCTADHA